MKTTRYFHVDVFATAPLTGNSLTVFLETERWSADRMLELTREMKHFESIFLSEVTPVGARARVFTVEEELPFAGHPVLGAAAVLHRVHAPTQNSASWTLRLPSGDVPVRTEQRDGHFLAEMNQGRAEIRDEPDLELLRPILAALGLSSRDLTPALGARVISTGLAYLVLPVTREALARASVLGAELEALLAAVGAKFVLVLDVDRPEIRTWDNLGRVEDVATGSAAGPAAAFLFHRRLVDPLLPLEIAQGRFANRPSRLHVRLDGTGALHVSGEVWPVAQGWLE